jgi:hypothetical protein
MAELSAAQQTYLERLATIEREKLTALNTPGADAERLNVAMVRLMSAALVALRATQRRELR